LVNRDGVAIAHPDDRDVFHGDEHPADENETLGAGVARLAVVDDDFLDEAGRARGMRVVAEELEEVEDFEDDFEEETSPASSPPSRSAVSSSAKPPSTLSRVNSAVLSSAKPPTWSVTAVVLVAAALNPKIGDSLL
jgi:hypothetical protein